MGSEATNSAQSAESLIAAGLKGGAAAVNTTAPAPTLAGGTAQDPLATAETAVAAAEAALGAGDGGKGPAGLTREDVQKMIREAVEADRQTRAGENVRQNWLATEGRDIPADLHSLIPNTSDLGKLRASAEKLNKVFDGWIDALVKKGVIKRVDIGGSGGGRPPSAVQRDMSKARPADLIAEGLAMRGPAK